MAAATAVAVRQLGRGANKLHLGLDLELMFYDKLATQRGQGITRDVNAHLADMARQMELMSGLIGDNNRAVAEAITRFLANGDREADTILDEVRGVIGASMAAGGASVTPFPRRIR